MFKNYIFDYLATELMSLFKDNSEAHNVHTP